MALHHLVNYESKNKILYAPYSIIVAVEIEFIFLEIKSPLMTSFHKVKELILSLSMLNFAGCIGFYMYRTC